MTLNDLAFLFSVIFVLTMAGAILVAAIGRRWDAVARKGRRLAIFVAVYTLVLVVWSLALPRRFYAPGQRRCFDDWCVAAVSLRPAKASETSCTQENGREVWLATFEVSSVALRVRQRAADATAELEDDRGNRYRPCASANEGASLSDPLGPGESFRVSVPFALPREATPAGAVLHHGDFPGVLVLGADQSFLHRPALHRLTAEH